MPTSARTVLIPAIGDASVVQLVDSTLPDPAAKEVQLKVLYSGFAGSDINMRNGNYPMQKKAPFTPGYCFVGVVHRNGSACLKFEVGDVVACLSIYDAQATYTNQPEKHLIKVPEDVSHGDATALILDWNTAYGMVKKASKHLSEVPNKRVFIHGVSGAVGYALMVLCKAMLGNVAVYGTASSRNHEDIGALGATPFVYTDKEWIKEMEQIDGVHAVFDPLGFESWDESYSILCPNQASMLFGFGGNLQMLSGSNESRSVIYPTLKLLAQNLKFWSYKSTTFYYISRDDKNFEPNLYELFDMCAKKEIEVRIKREVGLEDVPMLHRDWNTLEGMGSVLVRVAES